MRTSTPKGMLAWVLTAAVYLTLPLDEVPGGPKCGDGIWNSKKKIFDEFRTWEEVGTIIGSVDSAARDKVILADLNGDGITDYILADDDGSVRAWINGGSPKQWTSLGKINPEWSTITGDMIRMADVDNDGKADMIALYKDGAAKVWKNVDNGNKFESLDKAWATGVTKRSSFQFQDVDGDGYADYVIAHDDGRVDWARNTRNNGKDKDKKNWEDVVEIAPGPEGVSESLISLQDIDGDGRADYVITYHGGSVKAYHNSGSLNKKDERTWHSLRVIVPGVSGVTGSMIRFADMDGDCLADFLAVNKDGSIRMWRNRMIVASKPGSMRFARLASPTEMIRRTDIAAVDHRGRTRAWTNRNNGWVDLGEIAPGLKDIAFDTRVVFYDINGDGMDDYIVIHANGVVNAYLNNGNIGKDNNKQSLWDGPHLISPGVGHPGRKVSFADLNGDGCVDFLIIYDGGAVDGRLNNCGDPDKFPPERIWSSLGTIATGVGEPGRYVRFADLTGDGRAEYIIQYRGGAAKAYNNTGNIPDAGRPRNWLDMGVIATGVAQQGVVHYADWDGDEKADYLTVFKNGGVHAYVNACDWKSPISPPDDDDDDDDDDDKLNPDSNCRAVQLEAKSGSYPRELWNEVETSAYWDYWLSVDSGAVDNVDGAFGQAWGYDSLVCNIWAQCVVPTQCSSYIPQSGSGRAHLIMKSLKNLHSYYVNLDEAVSRAANLFSILQTLFEKYYPDEITEDVALALLFQHLTGIADIFTNMAGTSVFGNFSDHASSVLGETASALESQFTGSGESISHKDELAVAGFRYLNNSRVALEQSMNDFANTGHIDRKDKSRLSLDDVFRNGAWLDDRDIPVINPSDVGEKISSSELGDWFFNFLHANLIDYSWRRSTVTIVGYHMSEKEYKERSDKHGIDDEVRHWFNGRGYFLISMEPRRKLNKWHYEPRGIPGINLIKDNDLVVNFNSKDIITSSVATYKRWGYNADRGPLLEDLADNPTWKDWFKLKPSRVGTFNIPVCDIPNFDDTTRDPLKFLFEMLADPDPYGDKRYGSYLLCMCRDVEDKNGELWRDQLHRNSAIEGCEIGS